MKILVIGDIHGHNTWETILKKEKDYDKLVFLGDYFDCFSKISSEEQVENFNKICDLKKLNPDKVVILLGNHDFCNYTSKGEPCSGFNLTTKKLLGTTIDDFLQEGFIVPLYFIENIIFSHAGVSKQWLDKVYQSDIQDLKEGFDLEKLNTLNYNLMSGYDAYGDTPTQSPVWIRPRSLLNYRLYDYKQVVGHTGMGSIKGISDIWFCDSLPSSYLVIENDEFTVKKL